MEELTLEFERVGCFFLSSFLESILRLVEWRPEAPVPVFFSSLALLKMTVNPSAEAGSFTSHSPNFGKGLP